MQICTRFAGLGRSDTPGQHNLSKIHNKSRDGMYGEDTAKAEQVHCGPADVIHISLRR